MLTELLMGSRARQRDCAVIDNRRAAVGIDAREVEHGAYAALGQGQIILIGTRSAEDAVVITLAPAFTVSRQLVVGLPPTTRLPVPVPEW